MLFEKMIELLDPEPHGAALNMAIDEVLLRTVSLPLLRVYRWVRPAISCGYFERFFDLPTTAPGGEVVRRWTGGGVVFHGEDLTYTLVVPAGHSFAQLSAAVAYREIHGAIARVLSGRGIETSLAVSAAEKVSTGCFENPAAADVLAGDRKIAGAAQRRTRWGLLHQGSIQGITTGGDFPAQLARAFAREIERRSLGGDELAEAEALAAKKYATEVWLRRF